MRVSFSNTNLARTAVGVLEGYGYPATQIGTDVLTDCPALLAVPAIAKRVGLARIESVDLSGRRSSPTPDDLTDLASAPMSSTAHGRGDAGQARGMMAA